MKQVQPETSNVSPALSNVAETPPSSNASSDRRALTRQEVVVLTQILVGDSNKEIGRILGISPRTVEFHRAHIMKKLGAKNAADLVRIAMSPD